MANGTRPHSVPRTFANAGGGALAVPPCNHRSNPECLTLVLSPTCQSNLISNMLAERPTSQIAKQFKNEDF